MSSRDGETALYPKDLSARHLKWTARLTRLSEYVSAWGRFKGGIAQGLMSGAAAMVAYLPAKPLGLQEGFWASITAIAVVQTELSATRSSARDQFAGAAIGGCISALIMTLGDQTLTAYAAAVVLSTAACWVCNVAGAARLAGSTATILLLVPRHGAVLTMMLSRISEVGWGVAVGFATVWLVNRVERTWLASPRRPTR
ncbi:MAG TPA: FUSC family protein [Steroidobacteraceae bacterium]|nr:FUSC family protein [Steroidobacteraceae bacterium]